MEFPAYLDLDDSTTSEETQGDSYFAAFTNDLEREYEEWAGIRSVATQTDEAPTNMGRSVATQTDWMSETTETENESDNQVTKNNDWWNEPPASPTTRVWWWPDDSLEEEEDTATPGEEEQTDRISDWIPWTEVIEE